MEDKIQWKRKKYLTNKIKMLLLKDNFTKSSSKIIDEFKKSKIMFIRYFKRKHLRSLKFYKIHSGHPI